MIGADNTGYEQVIGKHRLGQMNGNGEMFVDFCAEHSHWWKVVSYTNYTGFTEPCCGELNRPHVFWKNI